MVEISLEAITLADSARYTKFDVISIPFAGFPNIRKTPHGMSASALDDLESQYGIRYKYMYGINNNNQYTQAYITSWDEQFLYFFIWSNQAPKLNTTIRLTLVTPIEYIGSTAEVLQIGESLIEGSLAIKQQFESLKQMDLRVSFAMFEVTDSISLSNFMGKYWRAGTYNNVNYVVGVHIKIDGVGRFWGYLKPENIIYDSEFAIYSFECFDWIKFILDTKGQNNLPDYPAPNLSDFLTDNMFVFNELIIDVGTISQTWVKNDYNYIIEYNGDGNEVVVSIENLMTVKDLIVECIKHYNAYLYYDGDKNLVFKSRSKYNTLTDNTIGDKVISGTLSKSYALRDYDSLLINVEGTWLGLNGVSGEYNGWALVWMDDGELQSLPVDADLGNIPIGRKYLDLRQLIPYASFFYRLFASRERDEVYNDYAHLLVNVDKYNAEVVRTDLSLGDLVNLGGRNDFIIRDIEIIPDEGKSILIMEQAIGN